MTLLSIAQAVADEIKDTRPTSVVSNSDPTVQMYLRLANRVGKQLMKKVVWQILRKEKTFTALATETQTSILPSDFDRFVPETFWDRTNRRLMIGPISATKWQSLKASSYADANRQFVLRGDAILVIPTFSAGESLAFEYVSNLWCESSGGTGQTAFAADTDVSLIDEELIIRGMKFCYLTDEGLPNVAAQRDFMDYFEDVVSNDQPNVPILAAADIFSATSSRHFQGAPLDSGASTVLT